jgi:hypothetical protein
MLAGVSLLAPAWLPVSRKRAVSERGFLGADAAALALKAGAGVARCGSLPEVLEELLELVLLVHEAQRVVGALVDEVGGGGDQPPSTTMSVPVM